MASERSTDVQAFIGELDGGVFETKTSNGTPVNVAS